MNTKSSIFTSGSSHEWKYKFFVFMTEIKFVLTYTEKNKKNKKKKQQKNKKKKKKQQIFCFF